MTLILKSNKAYAGVNELPDVGVVTKSAQDIYDAYAARVAAAGGTMQNAAACLAAITDAVNHGYFHGASLAISPAWGIKTSGANITTFYNLAPGGPDGVCTGTITLDTTTEAFATAKFDSASLDIINFSQVPLSVDGNFGFASCGRWSSVGGNLTFTTGGVAWAFLGYLARVDVGGVTKLRAGPEYATTSKTASGLFVEQDISKMTTMQDGVVLKSAFTSWTAIADAAKADMQVKSAGTDWGLAEMWYFKQATLASMMSATQRMGVSY